MIELFGRSYGHAKQYRQATHRTRSPRETIEDYSRFMPLMGITRLANLTGLDRIGIPVYTAIRPNARSLATSQGKGFDADSAKASALMECIEVWHGENTGQPLRLASYLALRDEVPVVDAAQLPLTGAHPLRLDEARLWIEGWDLMDGRAMWVPFDCASVNMVFPEGQSPTFLRSSNGLASGNHILEALVHALCETIERDADALWRSQDRLLQLDLATVTDPWCTWTVDRLQQAGVRVVAWDITSDIGIPVYACCILEKPDRQNRRSLGIAFGFGCHLSPGVALMRAISEAVQTRLTFIAGSRDDLDYAQYSHQQSWDYLEQVWEETGQPGSIIGFDSEQDASADTFEEDIRLLVSSLRGAGIDHAVAVDLTKPEIGIPVVKVVVPGLAGPAQAKHLPEARLARRRAA